MEISLQKTLFKLKTQVWSESYVVHFLKLGYAVI